MGGGVCLRCLLVQMMCLPQKRMCMRCWRLRLATEGMKLDKGFTCVVLVLLNGVTKHRLSAMVFQNFIRLSSTVIFILLQLLSKPINDVVDVWHPMNDKGISCTIQKYNYSSSVLGGGKEKSSTVL